MNPTSTEPLHFPPHPRRRQTRLVLGLTIGLSGLMLAIVCSAAYFVAQTVWSSIAKDVGGLFLLIPAAAGLGAMALGAIIALSGRNDGVTISEDEITLVLGWQTTGISLAGIRRISASRVSQRLTVPRWRLDILGGTGEQLSLELPPGPEAPLFDVSAILRAILERVPQSPILSKEVELYLEIGKLPAPAPQ